MKLSKIILLLLLIGILHLIVQELLGQSGGVVGEIRKTVKL